MRTIAIMSPKGGIAKTTSADTIAYILGEEKGIQICRRRVRYKLFYRADRLSEYRHYNSKRIFNADRYEIAFGERKNAD